MAYSDYIQIYDVRECAGIGTNDNRATQVEKMAEWLNKDFGNLITATVVDNNSVRIVDESVGAGIMWGTNPKATTSTDCKMHIYNNGSVYVQVEASTSSSGVARMNNFPIEYLKLFVCKGENGYVLDLIGVGNDYGYWNNPMFIVMNGKNSTDTDLRLALFGSVNSAATQYFYWYLKCAGNGTLLATEKKQLEYFGYPNTALQQTLLTRYTPIGIDAALDGLYKMDGAMPKCKALFELNNNKYLSLNYNDYGDGCGLALKLD